jgi:hypothetical protein
LKPQKTWGYFDTIVVVQITLSMLALGAIALWLPACGGAAFSLDPNALLDASPEATTGFDAAPDAPKFTDHPPVDGGVIFDAGADPGPDASPTPDAMADAEPTLDASPIDAPEAPDACAAPTWTCQGTQRVNAQSFCVVYRPAPDASVLPGLEAGASYVTAQAYQSSGCGRCGGSCACLAAHITCFSIGPGIPHFAGCIETASGEVTVTCQE